VGVRAVALQGDPSCSTPEPGALPGAREDEDGSANSGRLADRGEPGASCLRAARKICAPIDLSPVISCGFHVPLHRDAVPVAVGAAGLQSRRLNALPAYGIARPRLPKVARIVRSDTRKALEVSTVETPYARGDTLNAVR
jgi:hypothetical protein